MHKKLLVKGETRTHVLLLGRPQIILINLYAKCQKLRQVMEVGQLPEVATNSDYATCSLKRELSRGKKHPHFPITLAYRKCKQKLPKLPCLAHYNRNKENIVTTDASKTGLGIALRQRQGNNELKPIAFASPYLNDAEKKNSTGELELLAVV